MALETLKKFDTIDGHHICRIDEGEEDTSHPGPIYLSDNRNIIAFRIQNGAIKEVGYNGCQATTLIATALHMIKGLNDKFPCRENFISCTKLEEALMWQRERTKRREELGIEGLSMEDNDEA